MRLLSASCAYSLLRNEQFWSSWNSWCWSKWRCSEYLLSKTCCHSRKDSVTSLMQCKHCEDWHWSENWHSSNASKSEHFDLISILIVTFNELVVTSFCHDQQSFWERRSWRVHSKIKSFTMKICWSKFSSLLMNNNKAKKVWLIRARFLKTYLIDVKRDWTEKRMMLLTVNCASMSCIEAVTL